MDKLDIKSRSHNCSERFFYKIVVLVSVPLKSNTVNTILISTFHSKVEAFYGNNFLTCLHLLARISGVVFKLGLWSLPKCDTDISEADHLLQAVFVFYG